MSYEPHRAYIAPARGTTELPRLALGIMGIEFLYGLAMATIAWALAVTGLGADGFTLGDTPMGMLAQLASFAVLGGLVIATVRAQHGRGFFSLTGPPLTALHHARNTCIWVITLLLVLEVLPPYWSPESVAAHRPFLLWVLLMPLSVAALVIQTGAEELFYRGYIQQQIAARADNPLIWLTVPNLLFAAAHWNNGASFAESSQYVIWAFFFGLAASDLTARTGTIGAALGFHLANNIVAFTLFGEEGGPGSGLALLLFHPMPEAPALLPPGAEPILTTQLMLELVGLILMWLAARIAIRR